MRVDNSVVGERAGGAGGGASRLAPETKLNVNIIYIYILYQLPIKMSSSQTCTSGYSRWTSGGGIAGVRRGQRAHGRRGHWSQLWWWRGER